MNPFPRAVPAVILIACLLFAVSASAQPRLTAVVSSALGDGGPAPAFAAAVAHPLFRNVRLEVEGTFVRNLDFGQYYSCPPDRICALVASFPFRLSGNATSVGGNLVAQVPWHTRRIRPYLVGGAGLAHVRRRSVETRFGSGTIVTNTSSNAPLLTAGGGVEFLLGDRFVVGADARYQRMYEKDQFHRIDIPPNVDFMRIGSAIGYRF
jgi:opacity protein-like surface antigen